MLPRQTKNAAKVIAVFMGNQYPRQVGWLTTKALHAAHGFPQTEATIEHEAGLPRLDEQRVTRAAAAERGKTDHCNC